MTLAQSFAPIADKHATKLVLGSMPGQASLQAEQYYAHPRNAFWPIINELFGIAADSDYAARCTALMDHQIAVWDVLQACIRPGSLDADIVESSIVANDFVGFLASHPQILQVYFNGAKAEQSFRRYVLPTLGNTHSSLVFARLPSTSPAHASLSLTEKIEKWRVIAG